MRRGTLVRSALRRNSLTAITARRRDIGRSIAISRRRTMVSEATAAAGLGEDRLEVVEEGDLAMVDGRLLIKTITTVTPVAMELGVQRGRRTIGAEIGIIHQTTIRLTAMTR